MSSKIYRTCQRCGTVNLNKDYCQNCGEIINISLKRNLQSEQNKKAQLSLEKAKKKNKITIFFEEAKENENLIVRFLARFFYSIWVIVLAIGSFLAFLLGYIAA